MQVGGDDIPVEYLARNLSDVNQSRFAAHAEFKLEYPGLTHALRVNQIQGDGQNRPVSPLWPDGGYELPLVIYNHAHPQDGTLGCSPDVLSVFRGFTKIMHPGDRREGCGILLIIQNYESALPLPARSAVLCRASVASNSRNFHPLAGAPEAIRDAALE